MSTFRALLPRPPSLPPAVLPAPPNSQNVPSLNCPAVTFTVTAVQQIEAQLGQVTLRGHHGFNMSCRRIGLLLQYLKGLNSFPTAIGEFDQLSSQLVDITELALMTYLYHFYPTGMHGESWDPSRGHITELVAGVDRYIETRDFVLQLRMATLVKMLYPEERPLAALSPPCVTSSPSQYAAPNHSLAPVPWHPAAVESPTQMNSLAPLALPSPFCPMNYVQAPTQFYGSEDFALGGQMDHLETTPLVAPDNRGPQSSQPYGSAESSEFAYTDSGLADTEALLDLFLSLSDPSCTPPTSPYANDNLDSEKILEILLAIGMAPEPVLSPQIAVVSDLTDGESPSIFNALHFNHLLGNTVESLPASDSAELQQAYLSSFSAKVTFTSSPSDSTPDPSCDATQCLPTTPAANRAPIHIDALDGLKENFAETTGTNTHILPRTRSATPSRRQFSWRFINGTGPLSPED